MEILQEDGTMARLPELTTFAKQHDLSIVSIVDLIAYRMQRECLIEEVADAQLPINDLGDFTIRIFPRNHYWY